VDRADEAALGVAQRILEPGGPLAGGRSRLALERRGEAPAQLRGGFAREGDGGEPPVTQRPVAISSTMRATRLAVLPVPAAASTNSVVSRSRAIRSRAAWSGAGA